MKANIIRWLLVALALGVVIAWTASALASWDCQQSYRNDCGETAYDLTKVIQPVVTITNAYHYMQFESWDTVSFAGRTYLRFYDGTVEDGDWTWACFDFEGANEIEIIEVYWTDENEDWLCDAGSPLGGGASFDEGSSAGYADATIRVSNQFQLHSGGTATIYMTNVYWAVVVHRYSLNELNDSLFVDPSITWNPLPDSQLAYGESLSIPLGDVLVNKYLLFRFHAEQAGGILPTPEIWQIHVPPQTPSLTQWGLITLVALLIASTVFVMLRRRKAVVRA